MDLLKLLSANEIVAQVVTFLILLAVLRVAFWKKILATLDARKEKIASEFRHIDEVKSAAERLKADYEKHLAQIEDEAHERINEAMAEGRRQGDEIRERAEKDASRILENSKEHIKAEVAQAKEELKDQIVDLTIAVTEKIIQEKYSEEDDKRLIGDFLKEIQHR